MAMKELLRVTLDEAKIREACEAFVATRIQPDEEAKATLRIYAPDLQREYALGLPTDEVDTDIQATRPPEIIAEVVVRKRRVRKAKP